VRDHIRDRGDYTFEDLGEHSVKNIARPVRAFRILFDPDGTTELREGIATPEPPLLSGVVPDASQDAIELEFWRSVQASAEADEYGAYLERYPDGTFAPLARDRLAKPETLERPPAAPEGSAVELAFWDTVKDSNNPAMFQAYLEEFPSGSFRALAEIRLGELDGADKGGTG
jgi:adenylate cyclase